MVTQGKFRGKELLYKATGRTTRKRSRTRRNQKRLIPTANNRAAKFASRANALYL
jgi:hypothetical protein